MTKEKIQQLFKKIGQVKVEYFTSDHCACLTLGKIKEHVDRQIKERFINASVSQKNTNFVIALVYDQASNDDSTQIARIHHLGTDLIQQLRENLNTLLNSRFDQSRKIEQIKEFLNDKQINSIVDYLSNNEIENVRQEIDNIHGVAGKLTDWSITNVTGKELVVDTHIARVLLRTGLHGENIDTNQNPWQAIIQGNKGMPSNKYALLKGEFREQINKINEVDIPSKYRGFKEFKATQYLWFFGRNICTTKQPRCRE